MLGSLMGGAPAPGSTTTPGGLAALYRGTITEVLASGLVWAVIPRLAPEPVQMPTAVAGLAIGDRVLVGSLAGSIDDLMVAVTLDPHPVAVDPTPTGAHFTSVTIDDAPAAASDAVRKDYADALGTILNTPNTIARRGATGSLLATNFYVGGIQDTAHAAAATSYVDTQVATRAPSVHTHLWADITNKPVTFAPIIGTTSTTAKAGNWFPAWTEVTGKPATFAPAAHTHPWTDITGTPATFPPTIGTTATTAKAGNWFPAWTDVTSKPATFAPSAHTHPWSDITGTPATFPSDWSTLGSKPATFAPAPHTHLWADLTDKPTTFPPSAHTHTAANISDSTPVGRSVLTAVDAAAVRTAIGAGTSSLVIGTTSTTAMRGDRTFGYSEITGTVPTSALPPLAITEVFNAASDAEQAALTAQRGDMVIRTDTGKTYVLATDDPTLIANWKEVLAAGQVQSVAGKTGVVSLVKADVGLGSVDNTSDAAKPVSAATQTALNGKANTAHTHAAADITTGTFAPGLLPAVTQSAQGAMLAADKLKLDNATAAATASTVVLRDASGRAQFADPAATADAATKGYVDAGLSALPQSVAGRTGAVVLTKADVGLSSVDNTSDVAKPVSTATQTALNGKAATVHTHAIADVTSLQTTLDAKADLTRLAASETDAWVTLTLLNGWVGYVGGGNYYSGLRARRVGHSIQIQGMIKNGAVGSIMANFPGNLIPTDASLHLVTCGTATTPRQVGYLNVSLTTRGSAAQLIYDTGPAAPTFMAIDVTVPIYEP